MNLSLEETELALACQKNYAICSFKYNEAKGAPDQGIKPGIPLEDIPGDWICPQCRTKEKNNLKQNGGIKNG